MVKYSILVPVYNVEQYLSKCLDSIVNQEFKSEDFEVILVDDGSSDSSGQICDSYSDRYGNVTVVHQDNKGLLMARYAGVINSVGQYLVFIDSDDYIDGSFLSVIDKHIDSLSPDFMVYGYIEERDTKSRRCPVTDREYEVIGKTDFIDRFVRTDGLNSIWNKVVRADILRENAEEVYGFPTNIGEDKIQTAFLIKYSERIAFLGDCPYHYVLRDSSIAHHKSENDISKMISVYDRVRTILEDVINSENMSEEKQKETMRLYDRVSLSGILDHVYKYDKRDDLTAATKSMSLERIKVDNSEFFAGKRHLISDLKLYNRVRYRLLMENRFVSLIRIDRMLWKIQSITGMR